MTPAKSRLTTRTTTRRTARTPFKGRTLVAIGLLVFMSVTGAVVWRRSEGFRTATEIGTLDATRRGLIAARITLNRDLDEASSRRRIVPLAEKRLGMHVAGEAQSRMLPDSVRTP